MPNITGDVRIITEREPSSTWRNMGNNIGMPIDGLEAIKQSIMHILRTERYAYAIYPDWYGMTWDKYKGESYIFFKANIENDIRLALLQDDRITDVRVSNLRKVSIDRVIIIIEVMTSEGQLTMEHEYDFN